MGDKVAGFNGDTVMGGREVCPGSKMGADGIEGVMDVGAEGGFVGVVVTGEVVATINVKGFAAVAGAANKFGG